MEFKNKINDYNFHYKKILVFFTLILLCQNIFGNNCGGDIECKCGDTLISDYQFTKDLICNNSGLNINSQVNLNCNNFKLTGTKEGIGLLIAGSHDISINNCSITNFTVGIETKEKQEYQTGVLGRAIKVTLHPYKIFINNNIFQYNNIGIKLNSDSWDEIKYNTFKNNSKYSIYSQANYARVFGNNFFQNNLYYSRTSSFQHCSDNITNIYFYNYTRTPECNCIYPFSNLNIDSSINFCDDTFRNITNINILDNVEVNCNGATLIGNNEGVAIKILGRNTKINNCVFRNYSVALNYRYTTHKSGSRIFYVPSMLNSVENSVFYDLDTAISTDNHGTGSIVENLYNNIFLARKYNIYSNSHPSNAKYNYWGFTNESQIEKKFNKKEKIQYKPFLNSSNSPDLWITDDLKFINNKTLFFSIEKNSYFKNSKFAILLTKTIINSTLNSSIQFKTKRINITNFLGKTKQIKINWNFSKGELISIILDPENKLKEINKENNFKNIKFNLVNLNIFLNISLKLPILNIAIKKDLRQSLSNYNFVKDKNIANIILNLYLEEENNSNLPFFSNFSQIRLVSDSNFQQHQINISATNLPSLIFGIKKFNSYKEHLLNSKYRIILNNSTFEFKKDFNSILLALNSKFKTSKNILLLNNNIFSKKITKILKSEDLIYTNYSIPIKNEFNITENYHLLKISINSPDSINQTEQYKQYPIVMVGGLWSNINTWLDLGKELANQGYEVYLLELTGTKEIECDNCYNYNYSFLTKNVLPTYINSIKKISNKSKIKYIGHSNGARVLLTSLENNNLNSNDFDTIILAGVPGSFEDESYFSNIIKEKGNLSIQNLKLKNISHIPMKAIINNMDIWISGLSKYLKEGNKISLNLFTDYYTWIVEKNDLQPGQNLSLNKFALLVGRPLLFNNELANHLKLKNSDIIVSLKDEKEIYNQIIAKKKHYEEFNSLHMGMSENKEIKETIKNILNNKIFEK